MFQNRNTLGLKIKNIQFQANFPADPNNFSVVFVFVFFGVFLFFFSFMNKFQVNIIFRVWKYCKYYTIFFLVY